jgi:tRNA G18 (ribose-2'-O)-methylase SpoU
VAGVPAHPERAVPVKRPAPGSWGAETGFAVRTRDSRLEPDAFLRLPRQPLYLVLDDLRSAFNVGSIFRTADTARLARVVTCGYTAHPPHPKLDKTALGTLGYVPAAHYGTALEAVADLQRQGVPVWALETTSRSRTYSEVAYPRPLAVVLGNEALGVSRPVLERCDELVEIPVSGYKNSLNVAVACGVVVFEVLRQWGPLPDQERAPERATDDEAL